MVEKNNSEREKWLGQFGSKQKTEKTKTEKKTTHTQAIPLVLMQRHGTKTPLQPAIFHKAS